MSHNAPAEPIPFRETMRFLAGAVCVLTVEHQGERSGLTTTSVSSFSAEPPTIFLGVNRQASAWPLVQAAGRFCVNLLSADQMHVADRFAGRGGVRGAARYDGAQWTTLATGAPVLVGALASVDCEIDEVIERHSHAILLGRVRAVRFDESAAPLLYWHAGYRHLGAAGPHEI